MPCTDWMDEPSSGRVRIEYVADPIAEAILCGFIKVLELSSNLEATLDRFDYSEAGVSRDVVQKWIKKHKKKDAKRKRT